MFWRCEMANTVVSLSSNEGVGIRKAKADIKADPVADSFFAFGLGQGPQFWASLNVLQQTGFAQQLALICRLQRAQIQELQRDAKETKAVLATILATIRAKSGG